MDFLPTLALIFSVKIRGILAFFDSILLKLHVRPSLNQFVAFVLLIYQEKKVLVFSVFGLKYVKMLIPSGLLFNINTALQTTA